MSQGIQPLNHHLRKAILVWLLALAGCGQPQSGGVRFKSLADESPIKVAIADRDETGKFAAVFARPAQPIVAGSFEYCIGELNDCASASGNRKKMAIAKATSDNSSQKTKAFHKIEDAIDLESISLLNFFAVDAQTQKSIQTSIRLKSKKQPAPNAKIDRFAFDSQQLQKNSQRLSGIDFDYNYGQQTLQATAPNLRVSITNQALLDLGENLGIVIAGSAMNNTANFVSSNTGVSAEGKGIVTVIGENFKPDTLYKVRLHFFDRTDKTQSKSRYLGVSAQTYEFVTDAENDALASRRARITMRALAEANDWDLGRYDTSKGYTSDPGYGWCHVFYDWVIRPYLITKQGTSHTHYDESYWTRFKADISASDLIAISSRESIHGSYFRVGSHAGMILAYDDTRKEFITLEGNFNNRVVIQRRQISEISWVGHIVKEMAK